MHKGRAGLLQKIHDGEVVSLKQRLQLAAQHLALPPPLEIGMRPAPRSTA
jgi:hypothetical protein